MSAPQSMWSHVRATWRTFSDHGGRLLSGAIAFYALLSIVPMCVIALRVAGLATNEAAARAALLGDLSHWVGDAGAKTVGSMLDAAEHGGAGQSASVTSVVVLVYAATRLFTQLKRALDVLWDLPKPSAVGLKEKAFRELRKRGAAFLVVAFVGLLLTGLVALKIGLAAAENALDPTLTASWIWRTLETAASFVTCALLFALVFWVLPNGKIAARDLFVGAFATAALFSLGATLVSMYVARKGAHSVYGAATSLVLLLLWVHYSAQVFFLGAAFTAVRAKAQGRPIVPREA
ncbi:MAG TPA: YihY/virulence factor BrkB family protein [Polyangiaceae bacterium]